MSLPQVFPVDGALRRYDWGSATTIPGLLGTPSDGGPVAELWLGAHPDDPSPVPGHGDTLDGLIAADPAGLLGREVLQRFGPRLPFLLKVLAAEKPLSIQVHPNPAQARRGFADEDARGVARDARERNYRDEHHKPELLYALDRFEALCGFRPVARTRELLTALAVPELEPVLAALAGPDPLRAAFTVLLTLADPGPMVAAVVRAVEAPGAPSELADVVRRVAPGSPDDPGVVLALLLNHVVLEPGEAIYLPAGNVHAYLHGTGVEIMANSDNVLRCGLTRKHVDVDELLRIADFTELAEPRWPGDDASFTVPVPDFRLEVLELDAALGKGSVTLGRPALPYLALCTEGRSRITGGDGSTVELRPGRAAFVRGCEAMLTIEGTGRVFVAGVGDQHRTD